MAEFNLIVWMFLKSKTDINIRFALFIAIFVKNKTVGK